MTSVCDASDANMKAPQDEYLKTALGVLAFERHSRKEEGLCLMAQAGLPASRDSAGCLGPLPGSATRFPDTAGCRAPRGPPDGAHADSSSLSAPPVPPA